MDNSNINNAPETAEQKTIFAPFTPDEESPYIFISYAHKDRDRVFPVITRLYEKGWRVWYDEGLPIGNETDYLRSLAGHIRNCEIIVVFITHNSVNSQFVTEKELEYGFGTADRRIVFCYLDSDAVLPDSIELLAAKKEKYPRTDEAGLEAVLEGIEGLTKTEPREAKGFEVKGGDTAVIDKALEEDEYDSEKCEGGIRLKNYRGSEENVVIPEEYKGQTVVELTELFLNNDTVKTVHIPPTVRKLGSQTFRGNSSLTDIYIPRSVQSIEPSAIRDPSTPCVVHCAGGSAAHKYATGEKYRRTFKNITVVIDADMNISKATYKYAFCSYSKDKKTEAEQIISKLAENGCSVVSSGSMSGEEKLENILGSECFIAFLSQDYMSGNDLLYLRTAKSAGKKYIIYALDDSVLPDDMDISMNSEQQLRYDSGTEQDRLAKLIGSLSENGCRLKVSADIPGFEYTTDTDGNIILTKYTGSNTEVIIPREHSGHPVTELRETFSQRGDLRSVTIPDCIKSIGNSSFSFCGSLTSVTIPDSVTNIGMYAFSRCDSLTSVTIPDSVISIGKAAFAYCGNLNSVTIPDSVRDIGSMAFSSCQSLKNIEVSSNNINYFSADGVLISRKDKTLISYPAGLGGNYTIPDGITSIGNSAFYGCGSLSAVVIPDGVTIIDGWAFSECSSLTSVTIPDSVTSIGKAAFYGCGSLSAVVIPDGVTIIDRWAFKKCSSLTSVTIPNSVTSVDDNVFKECENLTVYCPEGSYVWQYCEENDIPHQPIGHSEGTPAETPDAAETPTPAPKAVSAPAPEAQPAEAPATSEKPVIPDKHRSLAPLFIILALLAALGIAAAVQFSGLSDILGWLGGLLG